MSRTKHHRNQRKSPKSEWGAKYKCDKMYASTAGPEAKNLADSERRMEGKEIIRKEVGVGHSGECLINLGISLPLIKKGIVK